MTGKEKDFFLTPYYNIPTDVMLELIQQWEKLRDELITQQISTQERKRYLNDMDYKINQLKNKIHERDE